MTRHGKVRTLFLALTCLFGTAGHADQAPQQEGDTYKTVIPLAVVPYLCVSIQAKGARILLSRGDLLALISSDARNDGAGEERLTSLRREGASKVLNKVSSEQDGFGCTISSLTKALEDQDAMYVVAYLLEQGKAAVIRDGKRSPELKIVVDHYNGQLMGLENFLFADGKLFFSFTEWVSYTHRQKRQVIESLAREESTPS